MIEALLNFVIEKSLVSLDLMTHHLERCYLYSSQLELAGVEDFHLDPEERMLGNLNLEDQDCR